MENKYTKFIDIGNGSYEIWNIIYNTKVGIIKKARMGTWMHWCLTLTPDFMEKLVERNESLSFSNGCLKEISSFITSLYSKEREEKKEEKERKKSMNNVMQKW